ncbi:hypothetical protein [Bdellovibrio sp. HCB274]|uniref:hypothetical protein n=1 Tax=Bdellovibrio sp. HCB274 TaxID=3394361 RepID=UPI0039B3856F
MKKNVLLIAAAIAFTGHFAFANDAEQSQSKTTDTSKNPITGSTTTTEKETTKMNEGDKKMEKKAKKKTKKHSDGSSKTTTETETTDSH